MSFIVQGMIASVYVGIKNTYYTLVSDNTEYVIKTDNNVDIKVGKVVEVCGYVTSYFNVFNRDYTYTFNAQTIKIIGGWNIPPFILRGE